MPLPVGSSQTNLKEDSPAAAASKSETPSVGEDGEENRGELTCSPPLGPNLVDSHPMWLSVKPSSFDE